MTQRARRRSQYAPWLTRQDAAAARQAALRGYQGARLGARRPASGSRRALREPLAGLSRLRPGAWTGYRA